MAADNKMELATDVKELYTIILQEHFEAVRMINKEQKFSKRVAIMNTKKILYHAKQYICIISSNFHKT